MIEPWHWHSSKGAMLVRLLLITHRQRLQGGQVGVSVSRQASMQLGRQAGRQVPDQEQVNCHSLQDKGPLYLDCHLFPTVKAASVHLQHQ